MPIESRLCPRVDRPCESPPVFAIGQKQTYCSACQKYVHNLSALSVHEQRTVISRNKDLCVRYRRWLPIAVVLLAEVAASGESPHVVSNDTDTQETMEVEVTVTGGATFEEIVFLESEISESFDEEGQ